MNMLQALRDDTSRIVDVGGVKVHYHDMGTGPALIMIHGSGPGASGWSNFNRNVEGLMPHFRVILIDLPGFGKSDMKPVGSPMPGWWAEIVRDFMAALGIAKAHLVGNSMGGMISLKLAMTNPELIDRMLLMGPGGSYPLFTTWPTKGVMELSTFYDGPGPSHERLRALWGQFVYDQSKITEELVAERFETAMDPRVVENPPMRPSTNGVPEELWRDARLAKLPHETLITWGREDRVMPLDLALLLIKQIPNARLYVFPKCGHWAMWEHPEEFNRMALSFLGVPA